MRQMQEWFGADKSIVLYGAVYNYNAIEFYERYGFILSSEMIPPKELPNGKSIPPMKMVKNF